MSFLKEENRQRLRARFGNPARRRVITGKVTVSNPDEDVRVQINGVAQANRMWVHSLDESEQFVVANRAAMTYKANVEVDIEYNNDDGIWVIVGATSKAEEFLGDALGAVMRPEAPAEAIFEPVDSRRVKHFRLNINGFTGRLSSGVWYDGQTLKSFAGDTSLDFEAEQTAIASGKRAVVVVAFDTANETVTLTRGSDLNDITPYEFSNVTDISLGADERPLYAVNVRKDAGAIEYDDVKDLRSFIFARQDGDVIGPASSTDNAVAIFDGTDGKTLQNSLVTITDDGKVTFNDDAAEPPLNVTERSSAPSSPAANDIYLDNGTNTSSGNPGWRRWDGSAWEDVSAASSGGDVTGPASSTDNAIARFDGTGGKTIQNSSATLDDSGNATFANVTGDDFDGDTLSLAASVDNALLIERNGQGTISLYSAGAASLNAPTFLMFRARGSITSPTATQNGDRVWIQGVDSYDGSSYSRVFQLNVQATENHSGSGLGVQATYGIVGNGSTSTSFPLIIQADVVRPSSGTYDIGTSGQPYTDYHVGGILKIQNSTPPGTNISGVQIYANSGEAEVRDSAGNVTVFSPHGPTLFDASNRLTDYVHKEWNAYTGEYVEIDLFGAVQAVESLVAQQFIHTKRLAPTEQRNPMLRRRNRRKQRYRDRVRTDQSIELLGDDHE